MPHSTASLPPHTDDKLEQQHSLFTHYKDPCRLGPGEEKSWAIGELGLGQKVEGGGTKGGQGEGTAKARLYTKIGLSTGFSGRLQALPPRPHCKGQGQSTAQGGSPPRGWLGPACSDHSCSCSQVPCWTQTTSMTRKCAPLTICRSKQQSAVLLPQSCWGGWFPGPGKALSPDSGVGSRLCRAEWSTQFRGKEACEGLGD